MIKTILIFIYTSVVMVILIPIGFIPMLLYFFGLRKSMSLVLYRLVQAWALSIVKLTGARVTVTGRENIIKNSGICFVSNHGGYFDIVLLLAYSGRPFGFIAKKELMLLPFINFWIYILGGIFIDRGNVRKAIRTINKGVKRIKSGSGMLIFPEGHRSKGRGLLPFHPGSLKLATSAEAPIVPVAIKGSYDVFEKNYRIVSAAVKVSFLERIETASIPAEERKLALSDRIFSVIKEELEEAESNVS